MQRQKNFYSYQDLESKFEKRPSLWAEPIGDWGEGAVQLIEIPTKEEIHDNIAGFWRPKNPLQAKASIPTPIAFIGDLTRPRSRRWSDFLERASARKAMTPRYLSSI